MIVRYSPRSRRDLAAIRAFIARETDDQAVADRYVQKLLLACDALGKLPKRYPLFPRNRSYRVMPFGNYLVFFQIASEEVRGRAYPT